MKHRLPPEALEHYYLLGADRSYEAVAKRFGVAKVTVARQAREERWQERLRELEEQARQSFEKKVADQMEAVRERHLKAARGLQARAIELLRHASPEKAVKAAAALAIGWKHELFLLGEPTDRAEIDVAEIVKRESQRWLVPVDGGKDGDGGGEDRGAA